MIFLLKRWTAKCLIEYESRLVIVVQVNLRNATLLGAALVPDLWKLPPYNNKLSSNMTLIGVGYVPYNFARHFPLFLKREVRNFSNFPVKDTVNSFITPVMAQTKVIFKFRELSKGVELNSLSKL